MLRNYYQGLDSINVARLAWGHEQTEPFIEIDAYRLAVRDLLKIKQVGEETLLSPLWVFVAISVVIIVVILVVSSVVMVMVVIVMVAREKPNRTVVRHIILRIWRDFI